MGQLCRIAGDLPGVQGGSHGGVEVPHCTGDFLGDLGVHRRAFNGGQQQQIQVGRTLVAVEQVPQCSRRVGGCAYRCQQGPHLVLQVPTQGGKVQASLAAEDVIQAVAMHT